jgi:hypothetical protein
VDRDKRKRLSESRNGERKGTSGKKAAHNRSSSMQRDKKELRFNTDYGEYDQVYTASIANYTKFQKKLHPARRRDTFDCEPDPLPRHTVVQSTKYNPQRNGEIKALFRSKEEQRSKPKNRQNNHPFLKFLGKKSLRDKLEPYRPQRPEHSQPRPDHSQSRPDRSQHSQHSASGSKQKSVGKKPQLVINKDHINLRDAGSHK